MYLFSSLPPHIFRLESFQKSKKIFFQKMSTIEFIKAELKKNILALNERKKRLQLQEQNAARLQKRPVQVKQLHHRVVKPVQEVLGPAPPLAGHTPLPPPKNWYIIRFKKIDIELQFKKNHKCYFNLF